MDTLSPEKRSWTMSRIKGKDTQPELIVRKFLYASGFRFRVNVKTLPGKPDIVLKKYHTVIFIHGCFWHGHECMNGRTPKTHSDFWTEKFIRNHARDIRVRSELKALGWNTLIVWECQLKPALRDKTLNEIVYWLNEGFLGIYRKAAPHPYPTQWDEDSVTSAAAEDLPTLKKE